MLRTFLYLILTIFAITILRTVIGVVMKMAGGALGGNTGQAQRRAPGGGTPPTVASGVLRKCPACGTYTPENTSVEAFEGGQKVYFCSSKCQAVGVKVSAAS